MATTGTKSKRLGTARRSKKDEFYTQWLDVEREMNAYTEFNPDVFRGKTLLLPCDDPEWSNFTKFFALHFATFGLKKLISTSYAADSHPAGEFYRPTLFETEDPQYDEAKTRVLGKKFVLDAEDHNGDGVINIDDLQWEYLEGDGDFLSDEVTALRDEADFVITNPPFSLFPAFVHWLFEGEVKFSIIGHQNSVTYTDLFPFVKSNKMWLGKGFPRNIAHFHSPYEPSKWTEQDEPNVVRVSGISWYTNIDHGRRHEELRLMTVADNKKFSKHSDVRGVGYKKYDNLDALHVRHTDSIPSDWHGLMGVPITYMNKHNPDQFEIVGSFNAGAHGTELGAKKMEIPTSNGKTSMWNGPIVDGIPVYKRLVIRHKNPASPAATEEALS